MDRIDLSIAGQALLVIAEWPGITWEQLAERLGIGVGELRHPINELVSRSWIRIEAVPVEGEPGELTPGLRITEAGQHLATPPSA